eukprot:m.227763 g.227763  ORF g.227763 m.227763 type:complete len:322 (-) comp18820_c0_seq1:60-1025(-)
MSTYGVLLLAMAATAATGIDSVGAPANEVMEDVGMDCLDEADGSGAAVELYPATLSGFGYAFDNHGQLRRTSDGSAFVFQGQDHYEALGQAVTQHVYELMVDEADLLAAPVPLDPHPGEPITLVFYSEDVLTNTKGLLVLCNGAGAVRAGQWARSVIINQGLGPGSMLSYIQWAISLGWAVVVLNPNDVHKQGKPVRQGGSYLEHAQTVWDHLLARAQAPIYIVAHSFGGTVITHLAESRADAFQDKVKSIAFTDSVHTAPRYSSQKENIVSGSTSKVTHPPGKRHGKYVIKRSCKLLEQRQQQWQQQNRRVEARFIEPRV